jgi:aminopeptidase N
LGHFVTLKKPYKDINGVDRIIECVVLDYDKTRADKFYNQAPKVMKTLEGLFGEFPWWNDGCRFIQSNFEAMEHQSGIALGSDYYLDWIEYNTTLVHELSHEWWGNNITAYDYCDAWLHEGLATYAEALFIEKIYGRKDYDRKINYFVNGTYNLIPIHKKCNVLYSSWITAQDQDIYDKGALMMHSLRMQVNDDSLFFKAIKQFQNDMAKKNITEQQFIDKFNSLLGKNYTPLFDLYLNHTEPPILEYYITSNGTNNEFHYKWLNALPFQLEKGISITLKNKKIDLLKPTTTYQVYKFDINSFIKFNLGESIYFIFNEVNNK